MKRFIPVLLAVACGGRAPQTTAPSGTTPTGTEPEPISTAAEPAGPVDKVTLAEVGLHPEYMDTKVNPCEDFFEFSCGTWLKETPIPGDRSRWGMFDDIQQRNETVMREVLESAAKQPGEDPALQKIGAYYASCMDEKAVEAAGIKALKPLLTVTRKVKDQPSLAAAIPELHKTGIFVLFSIKAVQDFKDATKMIADIDQSGLGLPSRDYYLSTDDKGKALRKEYQAHVERTLRLLGRGAADAKRGAADVLAIETEMARHMLSPVEQRDPVAVYNRIDRGGLAREAPRLGWDNYFRVLGRSDLQEISVHSVSYTRALDDMLGKFRAPQWRSYLDFHVVAAMAVYLPKRFVDERFTLARLLTGQKEQRARYKRCVQFVDEDLGELLAQPFVARAFSGESKSAAETMVREVTRAFGDGLPSVAWMDEPTREKSREKLRKLDLMIGYPDKWRAYDFDIDRKNLAANTLRATRFEIARGLNKIGKPVDRREFQYTPQTVNAYYDPSLNQMVFLAGILQPPFYYVKSATAVNLGGMGMVVGHELTHGFDDQGAQFDANGNMSSWWPDEISQKFKERTQCVAKTYSQFEVLPGVKVSGELTNGENIADIGGVKNAFRAYRALRKNAPKAQVADGFTEDQQFFIALGQAWCEKSSDEMTRLLVNLDPHSPARFRINGTVSQLPDFAAAFQCKVGQKLRPEKICEVW